MYRSVKSIIFESKTLMEKPKDFVKIEHWQKLARKVWATINVEKGFVHYVYNL